MPDDYEKELIKAVKELATMVRIVYWSQHTDCGTDFDPIACSRCKSYSFCGSNVLLVESIDQLDAQVRWGKVRQNESF